MERLALPLEPSRSPLMAAGLYLCLVELLSVGSSLDEFAYPPGQNWVALLFSGSVILVLLWVAHAFPAVLAASFVSRRLPGRWQSLPWVVLAAVFGFSWQTSITAGDGFNSHPHARLLKLACCTLIPLTLAACAWLVSSNRLPPRWRQAASLAALAAGTVFNVLYLRKYQAFHGHLAFFNASLFALAAAQWPTSDGWTPLPGAARDDLAWLRRSVRHAAPGLVALAVATASLAPSWEPAQALVQRFSHLPASVIAGLPAGRLLEMTPHLPSAASISPSQTTAAFSRLYGPTPQHAEVSQQRGTNVLLIVLESVRADDWSDPSLTPEFHAWKRHGIFFPAAVAQAAGTPLAYGAMFTALSPSILIQSHCWARKPLFSHIRSRFQRLILTQPEVSWFDHGAITSFFLSDGDHVNRHANAPQALQYLKAHIASSGAQPFFAWTHLYEPHDPYVPHAPFAKGPQSRDAYRSEIAYVDHHLGRFMKWFFAQPQAAQTLVIVIADHGEGLGERIGGQVLLGHVSSTHSIISHIPMFMAGPGLPVDATDERLGVAQLDIMPTIFAFLGLSLPEESPLLGTSVYRLLQTRPERPLVTETIGYGGIEFFNLLRDGPKHADLTVVEKWLARVPTRSQTVAPQVALQLGRHKVVYDHLLRHHAVYDLQTDPTESRDLGRTSSKLSRSMTRTLQDWITLQQGIVNIHRSLCP